MDVDFAVSLSLAHIVQNEASYARLMQMLHGRWVRVGRWAAAYIQLYLACGPGCVIQSCLPPCMPDAQQDGHSCGTEMLITLPCMPCPAPAAVGDFLKDAPLPLATRTPSSCRHAVVLPAFETQDDGEAGRKVALEAVLKGKPYVVNKFQ